MRINKHFFNIRLLSMLSVGFASGLPLVLVGATLQAWFTEAQVDLVSIGTLSLLGLPYLLKFLWAPLMDYYGFRFLDQRRAWILVTQVLIACALFCLAQLDPHTQYKQLSMIALIIAFFSASQDIAISAYQTDLLEPEERGMGSACYVFAYRIALLVAGGLGLVFADHWGFKLTYEVMAGLMAVTALFTIILPAAPYQRQAAEKSQSHNFWQTTWRAYDNLFQQKQIIILLLFTILYKVGDALALSLITNFMLNGLGFSLSEVGLAYKTTSFIAVILGGFVGGAILTRLPLYSALLYFGLAQAFSNLTFALLAAVGKNLSLMLASVFIENFCSGLSTAALLAFIMSLCNHRYTASQFALLSAFTSLGRVLLGPAAGWLVHTIGWTAFFLFSFLLCFPSLFILMGFKRNDVLSQIPVTVE
ncbi:MAG TPA: MFS transporter [Gammaproteobacteria bacterium]|jgi:PAT family beta-lactamase induction signal transducer AmpG|nr:MFS transporter [Gammaproteobacteria bacterium]